HASQCRLALSSAMLVQGDPMGAAQTNQIRNTSGAQKSAFLRLARPHQWSKNLLLMAALIFSRHLFILHDDAIVIASVVAFCALASFAYALNDIIDREADRLNLEKRDRAIAS